MIIGGIMAGTAAILTALTNKCDKFEQEHYEKYGKTPGYDCDCDDCRRRLLCNCDEVCHCDDSSDSEIEEFPLP